MSDYPYEEFTLITDRLDNADRKIKKLEQELEAMWEHVKRPTQQEAKIPSSYVLCQTRSLDDVQY